MKRVTHSRRLARKEGIKDGKKEIPTLDQEELPAFEKELEEVAKENLARKGMELSEESGKHRGLCQALQSQHKAVLSGLAKATEAFTTKTKELEVAVKNLNAQAGSVFLNPSIYLIALFVISIVEVPTNLVAFEIFGKSEFLTVLMATGLSGCIPFTGHLLGMMLSKASFRPRLLKEEPALVTGLAFAVLFAVVGISIIRGEFFKISQSNTIVKAGVDPILGGISFFGINALLFLTAVVASFCSHQPEVQKVRAEHKIAKRNYKIAGKAVRQAKSQLIYMRKRYAQESSRYKAICDKKKQEALEIIAGVTVLIYVYRKWNLRKRMNPEVPKAFKREPIIKMPEFFNRPDQDWSELE